MSADKSRSRSPEPASRKDGRDRRVKERARSVSRERKDRVERRRDVSRDNRRRERHRDTSRDSALRERRGNDDRRRRSSSRNRRRSSSRDARRRRSPDDSRRRRSPDSRYRRSPDDSRRRRASPPPRRRREATPPEERAARAREAEIEKMDRDMRTVFAYNLPLRAGESDLFGFFVAAGALNDIRIIRDRGSGRSKGVAYVEFQRKEDVMGALALAGQPLLGQAVMVKASEAEKNLAWEAAEAQKAQAREMEAMGVGGGGAGPSLGGSALPTAPVVEPGLLGLAGGAAASVAATGVDVAALAAGMSNAAAPGFPGMPGLGVQDPAAAAAAVAAAAGFAPGTAVGPCRLTVSGLHPAIAEADLRPIFEPFGLLDSVILARDAAGASAGVAHVQFKLIADATKAMQSLDRFVLVDRAIRVTLDAAGLNPVSEPPAPVAAARPGALGPGDALDTGGADDGGGLRLTGAGRAALMSALAQGTDLQVPGMHQLGGAGTGPDTGVAPRDPLASVPEAVRVEQGWLGPASPIPTPCVLVKNMFDPAQETEPGWAEDITADVREECSRFGQVLHVYVDQNSKGFVYIKFGGVSAATTAQKALHGRWFAGRQIAAVFQFAAVYNSHFGL